MGALTQPLTNYKRIVVKIGSSLLVDPNFGVKKDWLTALCQDIADLKQAGSDVLVVSSGAIALGRTLLSIPKGTLKLEESQAFASLGQIELARAYNEEMQKFHLRTGQILLTLEDTQERKRYLNARATINTLLKFGVVPVINENDTVATSEIRYGDNDRLSARVATMMGADLLILLSDIDGLYTAPPHLDKNAQLLPVINTITADIEAMAGAAASELSRGGMKTKLDAGKIATSAGTTMIITSGKRIHPLKALNDGLPHSLFTAAKRPVNAWKTWIAGQIEPMGLLYIDEGAVRALLAGKSLLPAGVISVKGHFQRGDTVAIIKPQGGEIARGLVHYSSDEARFIAGHKSDEIVAILGHEAHSAMVHRNDMVVHK